MRPIRWDEGLRFGNPNLRWGNPSYLLEPGDPGYVIPAPDPAHSPKPKTKKTAMSTNETPRNPKILIALALNIHSGQLSHGASVGLHHHVAAAMDAAIKKITGDPAAPAGSAANKGSQLLYKDCENAAINAVGDLATFSDGPVREWLLAYRKVMAIIHGSKASAAWEAAGFASGSTAVPSSHDKRFALLGAARSYLHNHAPYETTLPREEGPPLEITGDAALVLHTSFQTARTLINTTQATQAECKDPRDADIDALYKEVSQTIGELRGLLTADDPRWEIFGLNIPATPSLPAGITALTVTSAGPGKELLQWPYATRMEMTRLFLQRVGTDADFINVADSRDLEYTLKDLTPGATIKVYAAPHNAAGDGPPSPVVTKVVGA